MCHFPDWKRLRTVREPWHEPLNVCNDKLRVFLGSSVHERGEISTHLILRPSRTASIIRRPKHKSRSEDKEVSGEIWENSTVDTHRTKEQAEGTKDSNANRTFYVIF